jgi:prolyl 4-hydroxylase
LSLPESLSHQQRLQESNSLRLTIYRDSIVGKLKRRITVNGAEQGVEKVQDLKWSDLKKQIVSEFRLIPYDKLEKQPWTIFSALGERIVGETDSDSIAGRQQVMKQLASSEMVLLSKGGSWIWPGVAEGFRRTINVSSSKSEKPREVTLETLSLNPLVLSIEGFLDNDECGYIMKEAGPKVQYSQVSLMDKDKGKAASEWRTSQSTFLAPDDVLSEIDERVASLTRIPKNHGEYVQVLRYGPNEKYDAHHDFFNKHLYKKDPKTMELIQGGRRNRFATVFWYLTDVDDGGETIFPRYGKVPPPHNLSSCEVGLKVKPQRGKVIIFYSLDPAGSIDNYSLHGACPVGEGNVKWAANKWIWNAPMHFIPE